MKENSGFFTSRNWWQPKMSYQCSQYCLIVWRQKIKPKEKTKQTNKETYLVEIKNNKHVMAYMHCSYELQLVRIMLLTAIFIFFYRALSCTY